MICKKCGFEYVDGLKECPNCQEPNLPAETSVLSRHERDSFDGVTIEEEGNRAKEDYREERDEWREEQGEEPFRGGRTIHVHTFGGGGCLWQLIFLAIVGGLLFFGFTIALPVFIICAACYYLYAWLFR